VADTWVVEGCAVHSPVEDGTASVPVPMAMTLLPQLAACARWILLLSWS
jgi:hypothetical protein